MAKSSAATASGEISATNNLNKKAHLPLGALFCASIAALLPHEEVSRICNIQKHARSPLTACHASAGTGEYEEQNGTAKEQYGVDDGLSEDMQRADHRGHSEDKQDVEQVGADGIAQRQSAVSLFRGNDGGHQLRQGGADGDNGQSDEVLTDTEFVAMMHALSTTRSPPKITAARPPAIYKRLRGRERILPGSPSSLFFRAE